MGSTWRLFVPLGALVFIGLAAVDAAFVLWAQRRASELDLLELRLAAAAAVLALGDGEVPIETRLPALAAENGVELTLVGPTGERLDTRTPSHDLPELVAYRRQLRDGWEHVAVPAPPGAEWTYAVASRPLSATAARGLAWHRDALLFLCVVAALMVLLGVIFLRRALLAPVARMTALVGNADRDGLSRFGREAGDELGRLGGAIIAMTQRIEEDRQRIAAQLQALLAAHEELRAAQVQLVRAERLAVVGQLAAGLAHEIGNPLAVLSGYLEVLELPDVSALERAEAVAHMRRELERLHLTMRELLDFSRAPAAAGTAGEIGEALTHVRALLAPQERLRHVALDIVAPAGALPVAVETNAVTQLLLNLVLNAADALGAPGKIEVRARADGEWTELTVDDSGPGVAPELRARIFEPFFTSKPAGQGTGLGLAVCEHIASAAGGSITVTESQLGGARFVVRLPRISGQPPA